MHNELKKWAKLWPIFPLKQCHFLPKHASNLSQKHITRSNVKAQIKTAKEQTVTGWGFFPYFLFHHKT